VSTTPNGFRVAVTPGPTEAEKFNAAQVLALDFPTASTMRWRVLNYEHARRKYGKSHVEAIGWVQEVCDCRHDDTETIGSWDTRNPVLGTGEWGTTHRCHDCGTTIRRQTGSKNWSGD
jgi:hypothetical protein